jgi:hypothetical protein
MATATTNYSLHSIENYKSAFVNSSNEILDKYITLICEYLRFIIENIKMKNKGHFKFILIRGLETITHVFNNIFYYSKNLEMSYYHSQKAFYYYVEFIGQISEEQNIFLQLSSRDSTLYVYKKTIFEISNEHKKISATINNGNDILDEITRHIHIYKNIFNYLLLADQILSEDIVEIFVYRFEFCKSKNIKTLNSFPSI